MNFTGTPKLMKSGESFCIGGMGSEYFKGIIDDVRVYNTALSASTINAKLKTANTAPTSSITSPSNNATYNSGANITINANASDSDGTINKVDFYAGSVLLGQDTSSPYSYTWSNVPAGSYALTAKAYDDLTDATTSSTVNVTVNFVNQAPTVSLTTPVAGEIYAASDEIALCATAADSDGTVSKVEFYDGTTKLGEDTSSPYSYYWTGMTGGSHTVSAKSYDNNSAVTTSATASITVNSLPTVSISSPASDAVVTLGSNVTMNVTASDADGTISKVEFYQNDALLGTDTSSPYSYTWATPPAGKYTLTAKAFDDRGQRTVSTGVPITVTIDSNTLMAYWTLNGNLNDSSGRGHNGTFQGGTAVYQTGVSGNALSLDGTSKYAAIAYASDFNLKAYTVSAWVKLAQEPSGWNGVIGNRFNGDGNFDLKVGPNSILSDIGNGSSFFTSAEILSTEKGSTTQGGDLAASTWYLVTYAVDPANGEIRCYVDGDLKKLIYFTNTPQFMKSGEELRLGASSGYESNLNGLLDDVRIYSYALSTQDITSLYTAGAGNNDPSCSITAPSNGGSFTPGGNVTMNATASDADGTISKVEFYQGTTLLGTDSTSPYSYIWSNVSAGSYSLTAKAYDNYNAIGTSSTVTINSGDITTGLKAHWTFDSTLADASGNSHTGTFNGGTAGYTTGKFGNALTFDGSNDYVEVPYSADFNQSTFTVSAWVKTSVEPGTYGIMGTRFNSDGTFDWKFDTNKVTGDLGNGSSWLSNALYILNSDNGSNGENGDIELNTWHMVTYVIDNASQMVKTYLNSDLKRTIAFSGTPQLMKSGQVLRIGMSYGGEYMNGQIDDVYVFNRALSAGDINMLYNGGDGNQLPTCSITAPSNGGSFTPGGNVTITATASDADGTVSKVEFYQGTTLLATDSTSPYSYTWTNVSAGSYNLTARAYDNQNATRTSDTVTIISGDITTGLKAHWTFDSTLNDASGNSHTGTFNGGTASYTTGKYGNALTFDGSNDAVSVPYSADFNQSTFTVSAWVKLNAEPGWFGILGTRFNGECTFDWKVGSDKVTADLGDGSSWINTNVYILNSDSGTNGENGDIEVGTWHMVTYVIDNTNKQIKLYLNNDLKRTIAFTGTPQLMKSGQTFCIGNASGYGEYMNGLIDDVYVFNRALSVGDINLLYNGGQ